MSISKSKKKGTPNSFVDWCAILRESCVSKFLGQELCRSVRVDGNFHTFRPGSGNNLCISNILHCYYLPSNTFINLQYLHALVEYIQSHKNCDLEGHAVQRIKENW